MSGRRDARMPTGVAALDQSIEGGLPAGRATLVTGDVGAGKTTLALQFLATGAARGEPGVFIAVDQKPSHVAEAAARFGWEIGADPASPVLLLDGSPALSLMRQPQHAIDARAVMADLIPHLRARRAARLVLDALPALVPPELTDAGEETFIRDLIVALEDNLACTTLIVASDGDARAARISATVSRLATGVIDLRAREAGGMLRRYLLVRKMRATAADPAEREFEIGAGGVVLRQA